MNQAYFVAGTDTGVGKTFISCALLEAARAKGLSTMALKPVAAGCDEIEGQLQNDDAILLRRHMTMELPYAQVNPIALKEPASPHISAALENRTVSAHRMLGICRGALMARPEFALVEGAGGWRVPISPRETMADLAKQLGMKVIVVVSLRLGCLNHALLTVEAIRRDGLKVAGWVANRVEPVPMRFEEENIATLKSAMDAPFIGSVPFVTSEGPESICKHLDLSCLEL